MREERLSFNPRTRMGCDSYWPESSRQTASFNPRTRMGCDMIFMFQGTRTKLFQSTHPHGVRHARGCVYTQGVGVSIHAPAWGATLTEYYMGRYQEVSIHAPAWGATLTVFYGIW